MNLRILKKLSKRAAPLLLQLEGVQFGKVEHFKADREGHTGTAGHDRKHWQRMRSAHGDELSGWVKYRPRKTPNASYAFIAMHDPWYAWTGTAMVGWESGYETREWEECTAWEHLEDIVRCQVTDYRQVPDDDEWGPGYRMEPYATECLRNPRDVLRKAGEVALARQASVALRAKDRAAWLARQLAKIGPDR